MRINMVELNYYHNIRVNSRTVLNLMCGLLVVLGLVNSQCIGQTTTGTISGTIMDGTGSIIPNAIITVTSMQTGIVQSVRSNESGNYVFPALAVGDYTLATVAPGFGTVSQTGIHLDANQNLTTNVQLKIGDVAESVTVTSAAQLVELRESHLSTTIDQKQISDLPLNGRAAYSLVQLVPGVTTFAPSATIGDSAGTKFSLNGNRTNENSYYLDGAFDTSFMSQGGNVIPNPDALQEFRVLTNNFDAEYGRYPGGVVNVITRSGTNRFHGLAYDYLRNAALNAKSIFATIVNPLVQNQFGGNLGGPILHNKAFFFGAYEGLRISSPTLITPGQIVTPTPAEAMGDFRILQPGEKAANVSCNGVVGVICPNQLDPVAVNALKYVPLTTPGSKSPQQEKAATTSANQYLAKIDYQLNNKHQLSGEIFQTRGTVVNPGLDSNTILSYSTAQQKNTTTNVVLSDTWSLSPNKLNIFRPFYTIDHVQTGQLVPPATWTALGSTVADGYLPQTAPIFAISGYYQEGLAAAGITNVAMQTTGVTDTFNWTVGNHQLKLGGSYFFNQYREDGTYYGAGLVSFNGGVTGNAFADYLEGRAQSIRQNNGVHHRLSQPDPALFAQDDWRITHKLTVDLGVRWEGFYPFSGGGTFGTFRPGVQSTRFPTAPIGLLVEGDPGIPPGVVPADLLKFVPRVGFAYDVRGDGTTSIRGGFGMFYATRGASQFDNTEQQPFILDNTAFSTPNLVTPYAPNPDPFPYNSTPQHPIFYSGATLSAEPEHVGFPYVMEYNLTVEQQLGSTWGTRIAYVGSQSRKFFLSQDINEPAFAPNAPVTTAGINARRPYEPTPNSYIFGSIVLNNDANNANYNGLQATLTRRFSHGFSLLTSYVWSRSMDISSIDPANITMTLSNQINIKADYARSDYNIPNNFFASYIWAVPGTTRFGFFGKQVMSGWQVNGITAVRGGLPVNITSGVDSNRDGITTDRPNQVGNPALSNGRTRSQKIAQYFNTAAYTAPPATQAYGNVSRNTIQGPGFFTTDLSTFKNFQVWRESQLQFRAEIFNLFNNMNLANPTGQLTSGNYGKITALATNYNPRVVQFALKFSF